MALSFEHEDDAITGTVTRVEKKTLRARTGGGNWQVDPRSVTKIPVAFKNRWLQDQLQMGNQEKS